MKKFLLTAVIWKATAGFVSKCPELGVASAGDDPGDAITLQRDIQTYHIENI